jgi:hypothetical protein
MIPTYKSRFSFDLGLWLSLIGNLYGVLRTWFLIRIRIRIVHPRYRVCGAEDGALAIAFAKATSLAAVHKEWSFFWRGYGVLSRGRGALQGPSPHFLILEMF